MKILDIPQSGKRGLNVSQKSRNGLVSRALVIPTQPETDAQLRIRSFLRSVASKWAGSPRTSATPGPRKPAQHQSKSRLGQSGPLTGFQLYAKINCSLLNIGRHVVPAPPAEPVVRAAAGDRPGDHQRRRRHHPEAHRPPTAPPRARCSGARKPCSQGRLAPRAAWCTWARWIRRSAARLTSRPPTRRATARRRRGKKVFVKVNQNVDGWEDTPRQFWAIVPEAA